MQMIDGWFYHVLAVKQGLSNEDYEMHEGSFKVEEENLLEN